MYKTSVAITYLYGVMQRMCQTSISILRNLFTGYEMEAVQSVKILHTACNARTVPTSA